MSDIIGSILLCVGILFNFFGCMGLLRLPNVFNRLQASTKCVTLGTCSILLSLLFFFGINETGVKALISIPLLFLTASIAAHALTRGSYHFGVGLDKTSVIDDYKDKSEHVNK